MRKILVVDDEPKIVTLARDYLERAGFRVLTAGDGSSVLATVRSAKPDLIVLDLALPGMDWTSLGRCAKNPRSPSLCSPPVPTKPTASSGWS